MTVETQIFEHLRQCSILIKCFFLEKHIKAMLKSGLTNQENKVESLHLLNDLNEIMLNISILLYKMCLFGMQ